MEHAVLRGRAQHPLTIGDSVLIGPHTHLNGTTIDDEVFVATGASAFPGSHIGAGSELRINSVVHVSSNLAPGTRRPHRLDRRRRPGRAVLARPPRRALGRAGTARLPGHGLRRASWHLDARGHAAAVRAVRTRLSLLKRQRRLSIGRAPGTLVGMEHQHEHEESDLFEPAGWEERYDGPDQVWSGNPNPQLVAEASRLTPGTALDVGCGEGGDVVWLAQQGWRVTGADFSANGLARAARHAEEAGVAAACDWWQVDARTFAADGRSFDLVTTHFLHPPDGGMVEVTRRLATAVAPGGHLLVVGHAPSDAFTHLARQPSPGDVPRRGPAARAPGRLRGTGGRAAAPDRDARRSHGRHRGLHAARAPHLLTRGVIHRCTTTTSSSSAASTSRSRSAACRARQQRHEHPVRGEPPVGVGEHRAQWVEAVGPTVDGGGGLVRAEVGVDLRQPRGRDVGQVGHGEVDAAARARRGGRTTTSPGGR